MTKENKIYYGLEEIEYHHKMLTWALYDTETQTTLEDMGRDRDTVSVHRNISSRLCDNDSWTLESLILVETREGILELYLKESEDELLNKINNCSLFSKFIKNKLASEIYMYKLKLECLRNFYYIEGYLKDDKTED